jgi:hypothetical protein
MASLWRVSAVLATPDPCHHPAAGSQGVTRRKGCASAALPHPCPRVIVLPSPPRGWVLLCHPCWGCFPAGCGGDGPRLPVTLPSYPLGSWLSLGPLLGLLSRELRWQKVPIGHHAPPHSLGLWPVSPAPLAPLPISSARPFFRSSTDAASTPVLLFLRGGQKPCPAGALIASLPPFLSLNLPWDCSFRVPQMRPPRRRFAGFLPCAPTAVPWWW